MKDHLSLLRFKTIGVSLGAAYDFTYKACVFTSTEDRDAAWELLNEKFYVEHNKDKQGVLLYLVHINELPSIQYTQQV